MMRPGRKHNSILNSPFVRALINPVQTVVPSSTSSTRPDPAAPLPVPAVVGPRPTSGPNPYLSIMAQERGEEQQQLPPPSAEHLIPTQPRLAPSSSSSSSDVKGKKRARPETDDVTESGLEERAGTRYGVVTRYTEDDLPRELEKYWAQRYRMFSLYDEGCEMDREGWYSVTPENIAVQIAERCRSGVIVDAFCGVGGNAIQFAFTCERVIAFDTSKVRLACARRNAEIYGVADRITFILADWVDWTRNYLERKERGEIEKQDEIEVVFLSPPWGGISYQTLGTTNDSNAAPGGPPPRGSKKRRISTDMPNAAIPSTPTPVVTTPRSSGREPPPAYPLSALAPLHGAELFSLASRVTPHIAYYLPRNVDLVEVANLSPLKAGEPTGGKRERVEIEEEWMSGKLKAVTAYFGELVVGAAGGNGGIVEGDASSDDDDSSARD